MVPGMGLQLIKYSTLMAEAAATGAPCQLKLHCSILLQNSQVNKGVWVIPVSFLFMVYHKHIYPNLV